MKMKNVMIYRRKRGIAEKPAYDGFFLPLQDHASMILFFTLFLCGLLLGAFVYTKEGEGGALLLGIAKSPLTANPGQLILCGAGSVLFITVTALFGCFSVIGIAVLVWIPFLFGYLQALASSYLITEYAIKGFGYYCVTMLPASLIRITAAIALCVLCSDVSKKIAAVIIRGEGPEMIQNKFWIKFCIIFAVLSGSVAVECVCVALFSKLF